MSEENRVADLAQRERDLQQELNRTKREKFRAQAAARRSEILRRMTPVELQADEEKSRDYAIVFSSEEGQRVLAHLREVRPVVADEISERIMRVTPAGSSDIKAVPIGETANATTPDTTT